MSGVAADKPSINNIYTPGRVYLRLTKYSLKYWKVFLFSVTMNGLTAAADTARVWMVKPFLDGSFIHKDPRIISIMPFAFVGLFLFRGAFDYLGGTYMSWVGRHVIHDVRRDLHNHYLRLPTYFYDHQASGNLIARLTYHVEQVAECITNAIATIVREGMTAIGLLGLMFYLNWHLASFIFLVAPFITLIVRWINKKLRQISTRLQNSVGNITHVAEEVISGHRVVKIFGGEAYEQEHFAEVNRHNTRLNIKLARVRSANSPLVQFVGSWVIAAIIYMATSEDILKTVTVGAFISFLAAMISIMTPIKQLTNINAVLQRGIAAAADLFHLLDMPGEDQGGDHTVERVKGDIRFENLGFTYPLTDRKVLTDINLDVRAGQTIAFVGRTGAGKSTLVSLLPRFYDATEGRITLDGHAIRDYNLSSLRRQIAYVPQAVTLFNDSIARNIAYGDMTGASDEQIIEAAKQAHAWEFIEKYPEGIHTMVGQNGVLLSGGQRQRLAIARAILRNAPVLLLDEATSALDTESERKIQQALDVLMKKCTTLVVAHRLSTIQRADLIVVMENGRILETGRHDELLALKGLYSELHRLQFENVSIA